MSKVQSKKEILFSYTNQHTPKKALISILKSPRIYIFALALNIVESAILGNYVSKLNWVEYSITFVLFFFVWVLLFTIVLLRKAKKLGAYDQTSVISIFKEEGNLGVDISLGESKQDTKMTLKNIKLSKNTKYLLINTGKPMMEKVKIPLTKIDQESLLKLEEFISII
jgi:hypothetical protein